MRQNQIHGTEDGVVLSHSSLGKVGMGLTLAPITTDITLHTFPLPLHTTSGLALPQADALYYLCVKNKGDEKSKESNGSAGADSSGGSRHNVVVFKHKQSVGREDGGRHRCSCGLYAGRGQLCRVYAQAAAEETGQPGAALHWRRCRVSESDKRQLIQQTPHLVQRKPESFRVQKMRVTFALSIGQNN